VLSDEDHKRIHPEISPLEGSVSVVNIKEFDPNKIVLTASSSTPQLLTLLQNQYTGWKVFIDGEEKEILLSNYMTMSVVFPVGDHRVEFVYKNIPVVIGGIISYSCFAVLMIVLSIIWIREKKRYLLVGLIWLVLLGSTLNYFI
jgi:uncharacterized membrane protein YfhO